MFLACPVCTQCTDVGRCWRCLCVALSVCLSVYLSVSLENMAEPFEMPFRMLTVNPRSHVLDVDTYRPLANTIERSMSGGDAGCCITIETYVHCTRKNSKLGKQPCTFCGQTASAGSRWPTVCWCLLGRR